MIASVPLFFVMERALLLPRNCRIVLDIVSPTTLLVPQKRCKHLLDLLMDFKSKSVYAIVVGIPWISAPHLTMNPMLSLFICNITPPSRQSNTHSMRGIRRNRLADLLWRRTQRIRTLSNHHSQCCPRAIQFR